MIALLALAAAGAPHPAELKTFKDERLVATMAVFNKRSALLPKDGNWIE